MSNRYRFVDENKAHLHLLDKRPLIGNTSALGIISKNLTWWAAELAAVECLEAGGSVPTIRQEYLTAKEKGKEGIDALQKKYPLFKKARYAHYDSKNEKADAGTDLHKELEGYSKLCIESYEGRPVASLSEHKQVKLFSDWAVKNVKRFIASEGNGYNEKLWIGGITDLVYEDMEGKIVVLDFKSAKQVYPSMFFQCALCDLELSESGVLDNDGNLIVKLERSADYYAVFPFGADDPTPKFWHDTGMAKEGAIHALELYKINNQIENQIK